MKRYEVMYIVDSSNEDEIDDVKKKIEGIVTGREGSIISFEKVGKKRLAYQIAKRQYGIYFLINFMGDGRIVQALDYFFRLSSVVIRHIILVFTEKAIHLKQETERIQKEEAERMRQGGKPLQSNSDEAKEDIIEDSDDHSEETPTVSPEDVTPEPLKDAVVEMETAVEEKEPPVEKQDDAKDKTVE